MRLKLAVVMWAALLVTGCNQTKFVSTWTEPDAKKPLDMSGKKVATFMLTHKKNLREATEDLLATVLQERGTNGIAGYTLVNEDGGLDSTQVLSDLRGKGIDGALILRPVGKMKESDLVPGQVWYTGGYYSTFSGYWGYGWPAAYDPGSDVTNTLYVVETLVYSVTDDKLIWSGLSRSTPPADLEGFVRDLTGAAAKEMQKSGLLAK